MIDDLELEELNSLMEELNSDCKAFWYDETIIDEEIDYSDLKKRIYNIQREIKSIVERWDE